MLLVVSSISLFTKIRNNHSEFQYVFRGVTLLIMGFCQIKKWPIVDNATEAAVLELNRYPWHENHPPSLNL